MVSGLVGQKRGQRGAERMTIEEDRIEAAKRMVEDGLIDDDHIARYLSLPKSKVQELREGKNPGPENTEQEIRLIKHFRMLSDEQRDVILQTCRLFNFPWEPV